MKTSYNGKCELIVYELHGNPDTKVINIAWSSYVVLRLQLQMQVCRKTEVKISNAFGK